MPNRNREAPRNRIWTSLPAADRAYLESISRLHHPVAGQTLYQRDQGTSEIWFPHAGLVALTTTDATGRTVQTGVIGSDGCVGLGSLFSPISHHPDATVQVPGAMAVLQAHQLGDAMAARPAIRAALATFVYTFSLQSVQTIVCNRLHSLHQRCCRWLLTIQNLLDSNDIPLTQENLAILLGSGRPRVNAMLAAMESVGSVHRRRGRLLIERRADLKRETCDCYRLLQTVSAAASRTNSETGLSRG